MEKGFKSLTFAAGLILIAGFFLPWLEKGPLHYAGYSLAMLGYGVLMIFPFAGAAAAGLTLMRSCSRAADLLYPGLAGLTALAVLVAGLLFSDSGALSLNRQGAWSELISLQDGIQLVQFHPIENLGVGLLLSLLGTLMLCILPLIFHKYLDEAGLDEPLGFRKVIRPPTALSGYRRFNFLAGCLVILAVTWVWCGISPLKVWENRGHAKEYLFGRDLSQADRDYIQDQINRAPRTEAMGRAQEYMSNKYRNLPFDQRPDFQEMEKQRRKKEKEILASMDPKEIDGLKRAAKKDALKEKQGGYFPPETAPEKIKGYLVALLETIAFSVMPQVMPVFVSYTLLRFESNVRSAAILGFVGAGGIGFLIFDKLNGYLFREVCTMMIIIIITVGIIDHLCSRIRMKFI